MDTHIQCCSTEPAEDNIVDCTYSCTGKHGDYLFGNERHVDADTVSFLHTDFPKRICKPGYL